MIIQDELVSALLREGEGDVFLSSAPSLDQIISPEGKLLQPAGQVPILDGVRAIGALSRQLLSTAGGADQSKFKVMVAMERQTLQALLVSLVRVQVAHGDLAPKGREPLRLSEDVQLIRNCLAHAAGMVKELESNKALSIDRWHKALEKSPDLGLTTRILATNDPDAPALIGPTGPLPKIAGKTPHVLPASRAVKLSVRVWQVHEREGRARVEVLAASDKYSRRVLRDSPSDLPLRFDPDTDQRDDLLAAQYGRVALPIVASAACAVSSHFGRSAHLTLIRVAAGRPALDKLHAQAAQLELDLGQPDAETEQDESDSVA